jgi:hydrogenase expression/formation protein HypD
MSLTDSFRNPELAQKLVADIKRHGRPAQLMEFCGSHTAAIMRFGLRQLMPPGVEMLSGPGCPVCVTANVDIDSAIALTQVPGLTLTTFGDMLKVPGSEGSLAQARASGADVRVVYSTLDALEIARANPARQVVFLGVGFETTAPTIAASVVQAESEGLKNYSVLSLAKVCPPVIKAILDAGEVKIDGIICPGHVSAIIGSHPWEFMASDYGIACVVAGFEPVDILQAVDMLLRQKEDGRPRVEIAYTRGVTREGNPRAQELLARVFTPAAVSWRGVGEVPGSGLKLSASYSDFDAEKRFTVTPVPLKEHQGCICGEILRAVKTPTQCPLFRRACTPERPVGPCMVSGEGACASYFLYGEEDGG